jgi:hypothetical protein
VQCPRVSFMGGQHARDRDDAPTPFSGSGWTPRIRPPRSRHAARKNLWRECKSKAVPPCQAPAMQGLIDAFRDRRAARAGQARCVGQQVAQAVLHDRRPGQRALGRSSGVSPPLGDDALAFVPDAERERSSRCAVGDVRRAGVASRSPALPPPRPRSRAVVLVGCHSRGCRLVFGGGDPRPRS